MNNARAVMTPNWMMKTAEIVEKEKMNTFELAMECSRNARNHQTAQPLVHRMMASCLQS